MSYESGITKGCNNTGMSGAQWSLPPAAGIWYAVTHFRIDNLEELELLFHVDKLCNVMRRFSLELAARSPKKPQKHGDIHIDIERCNDFCDSMRESMHLVLVNSSSSSNHSSENHSSANYSTLGVQEIVKMLEKLSPAYRDLVSIYVRDLLNVQKSNDHNWEDPRFTC